METKVLAGLTDLWVLQETRDPLDFLGLRVRVRPDHRDPRERLVIQARMEQQVRRVHEEYQGRLVKEERQESREALARQGVPAQAG